MQQTKSILLSFFAAMTLVVVIGGCGDGSAKIPQTYPATITITKEGKPFDDLSVYLEGAVGAEWIVTGKTGADGKASLKTKYLSFERSGAPKGEYVVRLAQKPFSMPGEIDEDTYSKLSEPEKQTYLKKLTDFKSKNLMIPNQLTSSGRTPLKLAVTKTGNHLAIELSDYQ